MRESLAESDLPIFAGDAATHGNAETFVLRPETVVFRLKRFEVAPLLSSLDLPGDRLSYPHDVPSLAVSYSRRTPVAGMPPRLAAPQLNDIKLFY